MKKILTLLVFFATTTIFALLSFGLDMHVVFSGMFAGSVSWVVAHFFYENVKYKTFKNPFKSIWFWMRYKKFKEYTYKTKNGLCIEECPLKLYYGVYAIKIGSTTCQLCENNEFYNFEKKLIRCKHLKNKRSYNPLNWLKKLFAFIIIAIIISSCVTVNVYQNEKTKVKEYKKEAQKLEQLESAWY